MAFAVVSLGGQHSASSSRTVGTPKSLTDAPSSFGRWRLLRIASARVGCCTSLLHRPVDRSGVSCQPFVDGAGICRADGLSDGRNMNTCVLVTWRDVRQLRLKP